MTMTLHLQTKEILKRKKLLLEHAFLSACKKNYTRFIPNLIHEVLPAKSPKRNALK
jgi:hypothetical protein